MSGRIPQAFLDDVLSRIDVVELIGQRLPLKRAGQNYVACCPFHNERTPSFSVSPQKQFYYCFGCQAHGTAIGFLMAYERLTFLEAVEDLAQRAGLEVPRTGHSVDDHRQALYPLVEQADRFYRQQLRTHSQRQRAVDYLQQRGLTGRIAADFGLGYAPPGRGKLIGQFTAAGATPDQLIAAGLCKRDAQGRLLERLFDRITFPIRDARGRTIGFGGRSLSADVQPKYLNSPEGALFHKGSTLYGVFEAKQQRALDGPVLVVEGYMDVIALAQHGLRNVVATLGTAMTEDHIAQLFRLTKEVILCFDGDTAGQKALWRAVDMALPHLISGRHIRLLHLTDGDPDSTIRRVGPEAFQRAIAQATPLIDGLWDHLSQQADTHTLAGRAQFLAGMQPVVDALPDGALRDTLVQKLEQEHFSLTGKAMPSTPAPVRPEQALQMTRTPLRQALALLLYRPSLAAHITAADIALLTAAGTSTALPEGERLGYRLLIHVATVLQTHQGLTAGALIEHYRGTPEGAILGKLATWAPIAPDDAYEFDEEFVGTLAELRKKADPTARVQSCLHRYTSPNDIPPEEQQRIRNLGHAPNI